jgi:hypothetical protein
MSDNAEFRSSGAKTPYGDALDKIDSLRAELAKVQHRLEYDAEFGRRLCVENEALRAELAAVREKTQR